MSTSCLSCVSERAEANDSWRTDPLSRCSVAEYTTRLWTFDQDVAEYSAGGWEAIGVFLHKLEDPPFGSGMLLSEPLEQSVVVRAADTVRAAGLRVSHVAISGGWTDIANYDHHLAHTLFAMEAAATLGSDCILVAPGRLLGNTYEQAFDVAVRAIREALETSSTDVRLAVEPLRAFQLDFMNTFREAIDLVHAVDHPRFGVWFDIWHLGFEPEILDQIEQHGAHIFGTEISDAPTMSPEDRVRVVPGEGVLPIPDLVRAIDRAGFTGSYALELAPKEETADGYPEALEKSQAYLLDLLSQL